MIDGILKTIKTNKKFHGPVNLGNPKEISINQLAKTIIKLTRRKSKLIYKNLPEDDPERRKSFRARHNCDNPGPKWKARYWSCKFWEKGKSVTDLMKG